MRDLDTTLRGLPTPSAPALPAELEAELGKLAPVATRRPWRDVARIAALSLVFALALLFVVTMRRDLHDVQAWWLIAVAIAWFVGFAGMLALALVPRRGSMMPRWQIAGAGAAIVGASFVAGHLMMPSSMGDMHTNGCLPIGLATALVPVVLGALALRPVMVVGSRWTAAGLGAAGGSLGGLVLHFHCPIADGWHLGVIHGGVVVVAALLAALIVPATSRA